MAGYEPYAPLHSLKPVADDLWIVDGSEARMNVAPGVRVPFPHPVSDAHDRHPARRRVAVVPLADRVDRAAGRRTRRARTRRPPGVAEPAPLRLDRPMAATLPGATAWAAPGTRSRAGAHGSEIDFDRDLGDRAEPEWASDIDPLRFRGSRFMDEIVFLHRRSRTLIVADLVENFEPARLRGGWGRVLRLSGAIDPDGKTPIDLRMTFVGRKRAARDSLQRMLAWRPERIVLAHGRWYPSGGTAELARAFRWLSG
jgi:hypothetical protein